MLYGIARADFESDVVDLVNVEREAQGLHPLISDENLASAARDHSEDMGLQGYFDHDSLDGRHFYDRIVDAGYAYSYCGENIAAGYSTPEAVVQGWMDSTGHRTNILNPNFCDIGVGYAYIPGSNYGHYWTQDFGRQEGLSTCPGVAAYTIVASAEAGGNISPAGEISVQAGGSQTFTITPDTGYGVQDVVVDGTSMGIVLNYTFSDLNLDHSILVAFDLNTSAPVADAGSAQVVEVGDTVTLDGANSWDANDKVVRFAWIQTSGPQATLSDENIAKPTFVATPAMVNSTLTFQLTVYDSGGLSDSGSVQVEINDNGISGFPAEVITFNSITDKALGIKIETGGVLTVLNSMDPEGDGVSNTTGMPQNLIYGLIDFEIKVDHPGDETNVVIYLPEAIPDGYRWFKYNNHDGWYDYSDHVSVNAAGDQVRLTLVDGGIGDDDETQNGVVSDPLGLGALNSNTSDDGGGGGCFIASATNESMPKPSGVIGLASCVILILGYCLLRHSLRAYEKGGNKPLNGKT
jgi:hypothetical protein